MSYHDFPCGNARTQRDIFRPVTECIGSLRRLGQPSQTNSMNLRTCDLTDDNNNPFSTPHELRHRL